jgi:hypothetical protein
MLGSQEVAWLKRKKKRTKKRSLSPANLFMSIAGNVRTYTEVSVCDGDFFLVKATPSHT